MANTGSCSTPVSVDISQLNAKDVEEFLLSMNFDASIAAKLRSK
jgi:hypothetical protein